MPLPITFPPIDVPSEVPVLAVRPANWTSADASELARRLGVSDEPADTGLWLVARSDRAAVEVYQASQSFRFARLDLDGEAREGADRELSVDEAQQVGQAWIDEFGPRRARAHLHSVTEREVLVATDRRAEPRVILAGRDVNYRFEVEGLPLVGPGAKAQVSVHHSGDVAGAYCFWRHAEATRGVRTLAIDLMLERFARSDAFADLTEATARVEVRSGRFGYLCLPPTEPMGALVPSLELRGTISTEAQPRYDFVTYVAATEIDDAEGKRARLANARPALLQA